MTKVKKVKSENKGEIIIYKTPKNGVSLDVRIEKETIWLDAHQIAKVFNVEMPAVVKHINNYL